jgi:hypothetical protein
MIFEYTDMNNRPAHCDVEKIGSLIIMTELASNTGASVTNSWEYMVKQYAEQNNLSVNNVIWIERYDKRSYGSERLNTETSEFPNYSIVTFADDDWNNGKLTPHWKHLSKDDFNDLINKEFERTGD